MKHWLFDITELQMFIDYWNTWEKLAKQHNFIINVVAAEQMFRFWCYATLGHHIQEILPVFVEVKIFACQVPV